LFSFLRGAVLRSSRASLAFQTTTIHRCCQSQSRVTMGLLLRLELARFILGASSGYCILRLPNLVCRPPPKSRDRTAPIVDNDAPPTESLLDGSNFNFSQHQHQHQPSSRSLAITSAPTSNQAPASVQSHIGGVALTVSGFYPDRAHGVVAQFVAIGDCAPPEMAPEGGNWFRILYANAWDAARAVRRDGDIINGDMMISVRLVVRLHTLFSRLTLISVSRTPHKPPSSATPSLLASPPQTLHLQPNPLPKALSKTLPRDSQRLVVRRHLRLRRPRFVTPLLRRLKLDQARLLLLVRIGV
jgi:hypothetical protein